MLPSTTQPQSASEVLATSVQQRLERSRSGKVHPEPDPRHRYTTFGWSCNACTLVHLPVRGMTLRIPTRRTPKKGTAAPGCRDARGTAH